MSRKDHRSSLRSVDADIEKVAQIPQTEQTRSPAYTLAFRDQDFMRRDDMRPQRLQLELLKPEVLLNEAGIESTVVLFGGARLPEPGAEPWSFRNETQRANLKKNAKYYAEARAFAERVSREALRHDGKEYVVVTGGGPGVMEAGNRGAADAGAPSIGLNIVLRQEPVPNEYITPELCFNFHYFAIRKMHFLMRAKAIAVFPGGFGTMDELFETLTLIQTERMERLPILLFGEDFWRRIINFEALADEGTIAPEDLDLFRFVETAEDGWKIIADAYGLEA
jgi:uncharacterized protein (TIGR00730 family)